MKIIDGLKLDGWQVEIPDCGRNDLPEFFKEMGYKVGVEVGTWNSEYGKTLCDGGLKVYGIDPYIYYKDCTLYGEQEYFNKAFEIAKKTLKDSDYTMIRKTSMEALKDFEDGSLDFVYIDGNHGFKYVTEDIYEWSKKVKKGGVISGHDYVELRPFKLFYCDVKLVVDAYAKAINLDKWYILGKKYGGKRDKFRSWFWINP